MIRIANIRIMPGRPAPAFFVALAAALGDTPAGLDTYRWLADDVLERRLPLAGPTVDVADVLAPNPVRLDRLTRIDL